MEYVPEIHNRRMCYRCNKVKPLEHFDICVDKNNKPYYRCGDIKNKQKANNKYCDICKKTYPLDHFVEHTYSTGRIHLKCKINLESIKNKNSLLKKKVVGKRKKSLNYELNSENYKRDRFLERQYNITLIDYNNKLLEQNNCCAICNINQVNYKRKFSVDHCHETGKIRGLLCNMCNKGISHFKEKIELIEKAINYIINEK